MITNATDATTMTMSTKITQPITPMAGIITLDEP
jgi:hypothetical protein